MLMNPGGGFALAASGSEAMARALLLAVGEEEMGSGRRREVVVL